MTFVKTLAVGTFLASTLIAGAAFAKGHDNGFGAGAKGSLAGQIDDNQSNRDDSVNGGGGASTSYGQRVASVEGQAGTRDNSEVAQDRMDPEHPSNRNR